ncbi:flagellar hook-length control protein FliK [Anoxybacillus flavithermus]|nr:flagellar hook-length control protein FliK [Anoxybacillus flavithermus]MBE2906639.1 flagellar hook-length control protein FliK [Anoxybacillus flavithermus]MBE2910060.1 flagellar hook-length control protein FliK [Anoxybacillus flavithermus]MBE2912310.1 flagellar hook-length control protein FliK [Anoxybacillus flavithermus]MBE2915205.1 flagellar hook-length control protein FliK [Anoxybacillus flavithermus]MBE2919484.1 flagellar hook-length control protein FliK [Anoxybacillus flavithermus]
MNIAGVSFMAPFGSHQQATVQTGDGDAFSQLVLSLRQTSQSLQPLSEQQNEQNVVQQVDWEQLQQWFQQLPTHDGYADKHILSTEMIQSFLSLLPEETKVQIVQRFSAEPPFETMFSASDDHDEKDELMLIIALFQLEQKQWTIPEPIIEQARATLRHLFEAHDERSGTITTMIQTMIDSQKRLVNEFRTDSDQGKAIQLMTETTIDSQKRWETNENIQHGETWKSLLFARERLAPNVEQRLTDGNVNDEALQKYSVRSYAQSTNTRFQTEQSPDSVQKKVVQLPQERKQWTSQLSHLVHAVQQSDDKHVPFDRPTIDTTNETPFVAQFERIVRSSQFTRWKNGNAQMLIRLHPEHLGYITIKLIQQKGKLTAKMITSTEAAKQLVEQHIHQLAHIADHITVEQFNVFDQAKFRDHAFHQQKQQQQQQQQKEEKKQPDQSFDEWLKELFHFDV